ncbi:MAG TPA: hypothetical protein VK809_13325 [Bacteroidia bacterium]|jgi:hypothetical protein|nr:hypothetical protein [Bacteroidia bacterium]
MRKIKPNSDLWQYLNSTGVLERGIVEEIESAKRQYRKKYLLAYKQKQRKENSEYTVLLSKENGELESITLAAKKHFLPVTVFLKTATLAYLNQYYIVPNQMQLAKLEQILAQCLNEVQVITRTKEKYSWEREQKYEAIEKRIIQLENEIKNVLSNPPLAPQHDSKNIVT